MATKRYLGSILLSFCIHELAKKTNKHRHKNHQDQPQIFKIVYQLQDMLYIEILLDFSLI